MFDEIKSRITGTVYTIFTPFSAAGEIDFPSLENYINFLHAHGAKIFYVMAYNSRYSQLTNREIHELNLFCIKIVKGLDREAIVIVGDPIHTCAATSLEFAAEAKRAGADAISLIVREKYFSDEQILGYISWIGSESSFPIVVHEMPFLSGYDGRQMNWPLSLLDGLCSIPEVIALKEDAKDISIAKHALSLEPRIRIIFAGTKKSLLPLKDLGLKAYLNGISIVSPRIGSQFWSAYNSRDRITVSRIIETIESPFFEGAVAKYGWHRCNKALLQAFGLMHRRDRMPMPTLSDIEYRDIVDVYERIYPAINALLDIK